MNKSTNTKSSFQILIIDILVFGLLGLSVGLVNMKGLDVAFPNRDSFMFGFGIPTFIVLMVGLIFYLFVEYKYNRLKLKNIFLCFAIIIAVANIIAIASLPNEVVLPTYSGYCPPETLVITPMMRTYYLLAGFAFALMPYFWFYLVPRKILHRKYMNILLYIILGISIGSILLSFIVEWQSYAGMFSNSSMDIENYALKSIWGHKNNFARILLFGIFAAILLRIKKKNAKWILFFIPLYLFMLLTFSKITILVGTLTVLTYLVIRIVMLCKKSKDNLVITLSITGFIVLLMPLFIVGMINSESGILFNIKNLFIRLGESAKDTFSSRVIIWRCSFDLLKPYQYIFGFGINSFDFALHNTYVPVAPDWEYLPGIYQAHNIFVEFIGRGGVILLGIYLFLYGYLIYIALKLRKKTPWLTTSTLVFLFMSILMGLVDPIYICGEEQAFFMNVVVILPIMSEYCLLLDKNERDTRKDIVNQSKSIKNVNFNNWLLRLNKKRLIYEAKYIAYDLNSKIRL